MIEKTPGSTPRVLRPPGIGPFLLNLLAYCVCAWGAFERNFAGLFHHFDGAFGMVNAQNHFQFSSSTFSLTNNVLQSIGNIQIGINDRLLYFMWPAALISSDPHIAKLVIYVLVGASLFMVAYALARHFSVGVTESIISGWLLGVLATPFVPRPFFYEILSSAPQFCVIAIWPVLVLFLVRPVGRAGYARDVLCMAGLIALAWLLLAAGPMFAPLVIPGVALYVGTLLFLCKTRTELIRKLLALMAVIIVALVLRWPWYLYGLFAYTAANMFPEDFSVVYNKPLHVSILFQKNVFGWAGPLLVGGAILGAILSLRAASRPQRVAAWALIAFVAMLLVMLAIIISTSRWILPTPLYLEFAIWPLYSIFAAIAIGKLAGWIARRYSTVQSWRETSLPWIISAPAIVVAISLAFINPPTAPGYVYPPRATPIVDLLREQIALTSDAPFRGRVATFIPIDPQGRDPWDQQFLEGQALATASGNDLSTIGLWYFRIPTLIEYNQFSSPAFHVLVKRSLQRPPVRHQRNVTILTTPNARVLQLLGVRYLILPEPTPPVGRLLLSEAVSGRNWRLFELAVPNLRGYSPTILNVRQDFASTVDIIVDDRVDLTKHAVVKIQIAESLTQAEGATLAVVGSDLHVRAHSTGRSLIVVPLEYSHCLEVRFARSDLPRDKATLHRVDGVLTGILFEHELDIILEFRTGPLRNQLCRLDDYHDLKAMLR